MSTITGTRIDQVLHDAVQEGVVPNVVAMAADHHGPIYEGAAGPRVAGGSDTVTADTTFRIASMTKMVATTAALQLVEEGKLDLDDPVEKYRPEFAELQVLEGFDGDTPRLRAPRTKATVRHLASHTSGVAYWFWNQDIVRWEELTGTPNVLSGDEAIFTAPLVADPGTTYEYGINTDWLGRVVEAAGDAPLDVQITERILKPLGMEHTAFAIGDDQRADLVPIHMRGEDGAWAATDIDWARDPDYWAGGHGLYSTPRDYLRFQQMLLNSGTVDGVQILEHGTVDAAFSNQIGTLSFPEAIKTADPGSSADFVAGPGYKFGLGLLLNAHDVPGMRRVGSGAWAGLFNTHFWVDRRTGVTGAIYSQTLPFVEPPVFQVYADFEQALYASL
jgi:methyl acetate hydrolase